MMDIGNRIRMRRQELGLSLRDLAERVDLTAGFLSQIEREQTSPSIESLRRISQALDVPVFYFLLEPSEKSPIVRHSQRIRLNLPNSSVVYQLLTPDLNATMEAFLGEHEPGEPIVTMPLNRDTEEFIYVLQGQMEIQLGEDVHLLGAGDTAYFEGPMLSRMDARGDQTLRYISVVTPPIF